jgi:hypothetical protein
LAQQQPDGILIGFNFSWTQEGQREIKSELIRGVLRQKPSSASRGEQKKERGFIFFVSLGLPTHNIIQIIRGFHSH